MSITYVIGDATDPPRDSPGIIVHVCNDIGAWGKGFVMAISKRWKQPEKEARAWFKGERTLPHELGQTQFVLVEEALWVANLIGQQGIRRTKGVPPIRYEAVQEGLRRVAEHAQRHRAIVHMPRIGCGLAGGTWDKIEPIIEEELVSKGIPVVVYDLPS
ncbi:Appr-1-p processing protein [Capsulimonas corticalis]|uniref:Appr-1-p processing protein n=1 Tax=Capsulimonas corticalis TaxID=2219043 RepID=A0A402CVN4_9BACT|nr:macro domain-containing protein [Capsulimonas corticalis]BDI30470.1 Appr-1-p processing protein [Capsulimonas corticalis]